MRTFLTQLASVVAVGVGFQLAVTIHPIGWRTLATIGACYVLQRLYIPRYPRAEAMRQVLTVKKGQKVEVEGK